MSDRISLAQLREKAKYDTENLATADVLALIEAVEAARDSTGHDTSDVWFVDANGADQELHGWLDDRFDFGDAA